MLVRSLAPQGAGEGGCGKQTFSEGSRRAGGRSVHSQLVDGVLRDNRVGGEVGDHVGATEAAGAGGRRLPFAGQRAQGHVSGSRSSGPHPGPRRARVRDARLRLRGVGGAGSAGSRRPNWARRVAKAAAAAQGLGCGVPAAGRRHQPAPTRVRGVAPRQGGLGGLGGSAQPALRPGARGTHQVQLRASGPGGKGGVSE